MKTCLVTDIPLLVFNSEAGEQELYYSRVFDWTVNGPEDLVRIARNISLIPEKEGLGALPECLYVSQDPELLKYMRENTEIMGDDGNLLSREEVAEIEAVIFSGSESFLEHSELFGFGNDIVFVTFDSDLGVYVVDKEQYMYDDPDDEDFGTYDPEMPEGLYVFETRNIHSHFRISTQG